MQECSKCGKEVKKTHQCAHTKNLEYCVECYTELHYYLTEPKTK
jgi:NAD-dependent SIR2 family protein deacetylase